MIKLRNHIRTDIFNVNVVLLVLPFCYVLVASHNLVLFINRKVITNGTRPQEFLKFGCMILRFSLPFLLAS